MFLVAVLWLHLEYGAQREILSRCAKNSLCVAVRGQGRGVHARDLWGKQADGADGAPLGRRMARFFTETMHLIVSWSPCALRWNKAHKRGGNTCRAVSMHPTCSPHGPQRPCGFSPARLSFARLVFRAWANASRPLPTFSAILLAHAFYTAIRERAAFPFLHF